MTIDEAKVHEFVGRALGDMGAAMSALLVHLGDRLGLYKAMAGAGPLAPRELAGRTGTAERYVREWLCNQAAGGYVAYHPETETFELTAEQAECLANEESPAFLPGGFEVIASVFADHSKFEEAFRTGRGVGWHEHDARLFSGTERFFRPGYNANLASSWIPALDGVAPRLESGARVADIGCGHGASTIAMARAYPRSTFAGFDYHGPSIESARAAAAKAGVDARARFDRAGAKDFPGNGYDLVCFFDCLHDMGDPVGALRHVRAALAPGGTVMLVEPHAGDRVEHNLNPVGRMFYGASTVICTPASLSQEVGRGLGAQAGEARLREVFQEAGFRHFRKATATPFNMVFEGRV